ncbi:MAG: hypothetical protein GY765_35500 [bacterium]|nr:hypothetical protein [bacterium]
MKKTNQRKLTLGKKTIRNLESDLDITCRKEIKGGIGKTAGVTELIIFC